MKVIYAGEESMIASFKAGMAILCYDVVGHNSYHYKHRRPYLSLNLALVSDIGYSN